MSDGDRSHMQPAAKFQFGGVSAAVFIHERTRSDGSMFFATNTVIQRTYLDAEGQFQTTNSFGQNDLPKLILALERAYAFCVSRKDERVSEE